MRVIGTAGHVDHGKSTLIAALTGIHPDRLKEEQAREMTIELGFGWMTLPNGEEVGIIDVPGHRDFIENMLSGIGGIDAALLVIAADEGVMPQTTEHLAILDLLQIPAGIVVLTKTDLVTDSGWLDLVEADIHSVLRDTILKGSPIVQVSAKSNTGLDALISELEAILKTKSSRPDLSRPRLPVDRVFTMSGFGTIATGTLTDGHFTVGDEIQVLPAGINGRIRGLQTHKKKENIAIPGSRTAVNISGVRTDQIQRGHVIVYPNQYQAMRRLDVHIRLLKNISLPVKHGQEIKFFIGSSETIGTLRLLDTEELHPGTEGWAQLELRDPVVAVRGDRFILRRPSPGETLGGGVIVDHLPKGRHKRFDDHILMSLESLLNGSPVEILQVAALESNISGIKDIVDRSRLGTETAQQALKELLDTGSLIQLEEGQPTTQSDILIIPSHNWDKLREKTLKLIGGYHKAFPLRRGIPREELKSRLKLSSRAFNAVVNKLMAENQITDLASFVILAGHTIQYSEQEQTAIQTLMRRIEQNPFSPPSVKECQSVAGEDLVAALIDQGEMVMVSPEVVFRAQDYDLMISKIRLTLEENGKVSLAEVRDLFKTSRKYAQAILEHLDAKNVTIRDGDFRKLKQ